jgi:hypothetical protein
MVMIGTTSLFGAMSPEAEGGETVTVNRARQFRLSASLKLFGWFVGSPAGPPAP